MNYGRLYRPRAPGSSKSWKVLVRGVRALPGVPWFGGVAAVAGLPRVRTGGPVMDGLPAGSGGSRVAAERLAEEVRAEPERVLADVIAAVEAARDGAWVDA